MRPGLRVFLVCLAAVASVARAEMPAGEYAIAVDADDGLVLPSGVFDGPCDTESPDGIVCLSADYDTSPAGVVTGSAGLTLEDSTFALEAAFTLEGQMAGSTFAPKATLELEGEGSASVPDPNDPNDPNLPPIEFDVESTGRMKCKLDLATLEDRLLCKGKVRLCVFELDGTKLGCENVRLELPFDFEPTPFEIQLDDLATSDSGAVTGDGAVVIDAAPAFTYTAAGRHKPSSDTTNLKLTSTDPLLKTYVKLKKTVLGGGGAAGGVALFKIAGQKGRVLLPPATTFTGHGTCIRGAFCDVNQDTGGLFTNPPEPTPLGDTIFFGILRARGH